MTVAYSDFRLKLKSYLDEVFQSKTPLVVTRNKGENVVVLSQSDYDSIIKTFYLLKSPDNAKRLLSTLDEYNNNGTDKEQNLIEE